MTTDKISGFTIFMRASATVKTVAQATHRAVALRGGCWVET